MANVYLFTRYGVEVFFDASSGDLEDAVFKALDDIANENGSIDCNMQRAGSAFGSRYESYYDSIEDTEKAGAEMEAYINSMNFKE